MLPIDPQKVTEFLREVGRTVIMPRWRNLQAGDIAEKSGPHDLVTIADKEAEKALAPMLQGILPGSLVLGEESYAADPAVLKALQSEYPVWIIDPIDGTSSFASGKEDFGTIVALAHRGEVLTGWIHHTITGDTLTVERGGGAWFRGERLKMLPSVPFAQMHGIVGIRLQPWLKKYPEKDKPTYDARGFMACDVYATLLTPQKLFNRSEGRQYHFRASSGFTHPWDDAAGVLAIRESGGEVMNWDGELYRPDMFDDGLIIAPCYDDCVRLRDWLNPAYLAFRGK
ncbi:MAG: inositol monophosphatase family protein [Alphaproteobacteria bacterium]